MAELDIRERCIGGAPAVVLAGQLNFDTAPELREILVSRMKGRRPCMVLDLSGLDFMDTAGIATLIEAELRAREEEGKVVLFGLAERIAEVLATVHVTELFTIVETEEEAAAAIRGAVAEGSED